jgi:hypothetical protein
MNKSIMISDYDFVEYAQEPNINNQTVIAIYGIDTDTLNDLEVGSFINWDDKRQNELNESEHGVNEQESFVWNGEVYAFFQDYVVVYLY